MHFYLHIPFCESKCHYCAFTSLKKKGYERAYFRALKEDILFHLERFELSPNSIKTLFIGGGTPSCADAEHYAEIFELLSPFLQKNAEISSEANPNSASLKWLKTMKSYGLNRISFGAQSFSEKKLQFLGRIHDAKMVEKALENAAISGLKKVNLDLIYDTALDDKKMLEFELSHLARLRPLITHLSAYHLALEPQTAFAKRPSFKKNAPRLARHFIQAIKNLGFLQYEISNFAAGKDQICQHNLAYWQGKNYLGCGLSAVGFFDKKRFYTHQTLKSYLENPCFRTEESLSDEDLRLERIFLGLRSSWGVRESVLNLEQRKRAQILVRAKKLLFKNSRYHNPNFLLSDALALYLA